MTLYFLLNRETMPWGWNLENKTTRFHSTAPPPLKDKMVADVEQILYTKVKFLMRLVAFHIVLILLRNVCINQISAWELIFFIYCGLCVLILVVFFFFCVVSFTTFRPNFTSGLLQVILPKFGRNIVKETKKPKKPYQDEDKKSAIN